MRPLRPQIQGAPASLRGRRLLLCAAVSALAGVAVAHAQEPSPAPPAGQTTITVQARTITRAGAPSPATFTGGRIRSGRALPRGYTVVSYPITVTVGAQEVLPSFKVSCPGSSLRLDNLANGGAIAPQVIGPDPFTRRRSFKYAGARSWGVIADYNTRTAAPGATIRGAVHVLCR